MYLRLSDTEIEHTLFDVSSSSFLSGSLSLLKTGNDLLRIRQQRIEHAKNTIICHFNINSIRTKYDTVVEIVKAFDIFLISESKLNNTSPIDQVSIRDYKYFRRDHNRFGGGLILCFKENLPFKRKP